MYQGHNIEKHYVHFLMATSSDSAAFYTAAFSRIFSFSIHEGSTFLAGDFPHGHSVLNSCHATTNVHSTANVRLTRPIDRACPDRKMRGSSTEPDTLDLGHGSTKLLFEPARSGQPQPSHRAA